MGRAVSPGSLRENWTHPTRAVTCVTCFRCLQPGSGLRLQLGVRGGTPSTPESSSCLQGGDQVALRGTVPTSGPIPCPEKATRTRICLLHPQNPSLIQALVAETSPAPWASPPTKTSWQPHRPTHRRSALPGPAASPSSFSPPRSELGAAPGLGLPVSSVSHPGPSF